MSLPDPAVRSPIRSVTHGDAPDACRRGLLAMMGGLALGLPWPGSAATPSRSASRMQAYDLVIEHRSVPADGPRGHGWCFGLPPGITPAQWPLDPTNGYPLSHGFTLLLPPEYRVRGADLVALSFFGIAPDHNDGGPAEVAEVKAFYDSWRDGMDVPADPELLPFWRAQQSAHPHLHRMRDLLGCPYAVIFHTQASFEGEFCEPPALEPNRYRDRLRAPAWMNVGSAAAFWGYDHALSPPIDQGFYREIIGEDPGRTPGYNRAIAWSPRRTDPNAGLAPLEDPPAGEGQYQREFYWEGGQVAREHYREHAWARDLKPNHIGGTMRPAQAIPDGISPYYIEFEETFGGYNFGTGNAWLDLQHLTFDWSQ
ncbi:hypothetical protein [Bordetella genomosp. 5]|nr:hypothetical protein [Bordetella genomosp. 5]